VGVLIYMQQAFFRAGKCGDETPLLYYWLLTNIIIFYATLAFSLYMFCKGMFGAPSKEEVEEDYLN